MTQLASDNFERGDGGLGADWTTVTNRANPAIVSGVVESGSAVQDSCAFNDTVSWPDDQWAQILAVAAASSTSNAAGVVLRASASAQTYYRVLARGPLGSGATLYIGKTVGGSTTQLYAGVQTINANDTFYGEVQSTSILAKVNGSQIGTTQTDNAIGSGNAGLYVFYSGSQSNAKLDDWAGGDFGGAQTVEGSFVGDAVLRKALASSTVADAILRKLGLAGSFTGDALLRAMQRARPASDARLGGWKDQAGGTTSIYLAIDEAAADDADYIRSASSPASDVYVAKLGSVSDPQSSSGHAVHFRHRKDDAGSPRIDLTVELRQGYASEGSPGTLVATAGTLADIAAAWTTTNYTLSGAEADSITDYGDLYLRFVANKP